MTESLPHKSSTINRTQRVPCFCFVSYITGISQVSVLQNVQHSSSKSCKQCDETCGNTKTAKEQLHPLLLTTRYRQTLPTSSPRPTPDSSVSKTAAKPICMWPLPTPKPPKELKVKSVTTTDTFYMPPRRRSTKWRVDSFWML